MERKVKLASTVLAVCVSTFMVYWLVNLILTVTPYVVGDMIYKTTTVHDIDGRLHNVYVVHPEVTVSVWQRLLYGVAWLSVILSSLVAFYYAVKLLYKFRVGEYFTLVTTRYLRNMGFAVMAAMIGDTLLPSLARMILSARNPDGMFGPRYFYDPGYISLFLAGFGFAIIGWVFHEARKSQIENQEFV